ncbi:GSCFA domain-containing protein [Tamlana crocina]|uniref:GSCFA domain-containing protein n=1 Tax=Tamlana crocina TaxID=393006 RepID=A0ABX1DGZ9_9FLAO|nr:GSCFA domain-containing protein [Tamlana crocina]NJX16792.1 GSCFA domain-containing protein [Tamlana crocina]
MKLQTQISLKKQSENLIDYHSNVVLLGSCFSDNIGAKLDYFKFKNLQNPFGVLFQPKAIENLVERALNEKTFSKDDVLFHNEQWHCFDVHSKLSSVSKEALLENLNRALKSTRQHLLEASHIIITFGTAWVYRFMENDNIVANCHKVPQKQFKKELLSVEDISASLKTISASIKQANPKAPIIFTVSPVRHLKDGFVENTQSKAHLISAIHQLLSSKGAPSLSTPLKTNCSEAYFPSYEIMMDELRDYRFYEADMVHPNTTAIEYIWERFKDVWVAPETLKIMDEVEVIQKGLRHKPFNPNSKAHLEFLQKLETKKEGIRRKFPHIKF